MSHISRVYSTETRGPPTDIPASHTFSLLQTNHSQMYVISPYYVNAAKETMYSFVLFVFYYFLYIVFYDFTLLYLICSIVRRVRIKGDDDRSVVFQSRQSVTHFSIVC